MHNINVIILMACKLFEGRNLISFFLTKESMWLVLSIQNQFVELMN